MLFRFEGESRWLLLINDGVVCKLTLLLFFVGEEDEGRRQGIDDDFSLIIGTFVKVGIEGIVSIQVRTPSCR